MVPKVVVLECSPWWLNKGGDEHSCPFLMWSSLNLGIILPQVSEFYDLYSPIILHKQLTQIFYILVSQGLSDLNLMILPDGHKEFSKIKDDVVLQGVSNQTKFSFTENLYKISEKTTMDFIKFVNKLQADGVRVIFFLPPYHPVSYEKIKNNPKYQMVFEAQSFFIETAKKYHVEVAGSYNPNICGCEASDFYDFHHTYGSSTKKIFKNILNTL